MTPKPGNAPDPDSDELTPEQERIVKRVRRLSVISAIIFSIAMPVLLSAIIYRIVKSPAAPEGVVEASAAMPAGGRVTGTSLGEGRLAVTVEHAGGTRIILFDAATLEVAGTLDLD
ncbi:MAG: hypothetical protein AB7O39_11920 [Flavobacteriaceae bacterium]